jgi:bile acid:Na+ symporter, BASS family
MDAQKIAVLILLVSLMVWAGLQVNREHLMEVLRNTGLLTRMFVANFIIVPIVAVLVVRLFRLDDLVATGILLMAIAPGAPFEPLAAGHKKGGSTGFAICMAFLMPALSIITAPITAALVLPASMNHVAVGSFIVTLVLFQLIPLLIGLFINDRWPGTAVKLQRIAMLVFLLSVVVVFVLLFPKIVEAFSTVFGTRGNLAAVVVVVLSAITGWLFGGQDIAYRRTMAIGTVLRNIGLATLFATHAFSGTIVEAVVLTYFIIQIVVGALLGTVLKRRAAQPSLSH